jgi:hypothetical protein
MRDYKSDEDDEFDEETGEFLNPLQSKYSEA